MPPADLISRRKGNTLPSGKRTLEVTQCHRTVNIMTFPVRAAVGDQVGHLLQDFLHVGACTDKANNSTHFSFPYPVWKRQPGNATCSPGGRFAVIALWWFNMVIIHGKCRLEKRPACKICLLDRFVRLFDKIAQNIFVQCA